MAVKKKEPPKITFEEFLESHATPDRTVPYWRKFHHAGGSIPDLWSISSNGQFMLWLFFTIRHPANADMFVFLSRAFHKSPHETEETNRLRNKLWSTPNTRDRSVLVIELLDKVYDWSGNNASRMADYMRSEVPVDTIMFELRKHNIEVSWL